MNRLIAFLRQHYLADTSPETKQLRNVVYNVTTLHPANLSLYKLALQHSSASEAINANERLELLGDAVLSLIIAEYLYKKYPLQSEGFLTEVRARIVNRASLNELAQKIGIDKLLQYDTRLIGKRGLKTAYGNALEAFIGAVYLDQGYERSRKFVIDRLLHIYVDLEAAVLTDNNYKSKVMAWAQKNRKAVRFELVSEKHIDGQKEFVIQLLIEEAVGGKGWGKNKKEAEQMAAQDAWTRLS
ncbi:MAG: ribonuclease III [Bacteroidota bacterium]